ncbi:MAG: CPXCG motif-containing cysteine-rich protein [Rhodothermales bacterium]
MSDQTEYFFTCPYCWEEISMLLDLSVEAQTYVEDCEVCCNPIEVTYQVDEDEVAAFEAAPMA